MEPFLSSTFRIKYEWLPCNYGSNEERMTLADVELYVRNYCATELHENRAKTVRRSARLSVLHLAEWFASNWWRLIWELCANDVSWRMSHQVAGAGGGYLWPDLSFSSDWESITVSSRRTESSTAQPVHYLNDFRISIPLADFEHEVDEFLSSTIARLSDTLDTETELSVLWRDVIRERRDRDLSRWRQLEACMGYDPDEGPHDLLHGLHRAMETYGEGAVREIAAACKNDSRSLLDTVAKEAQDGALVVHVPSYDDLRSRIGTESSPSHRPWVRAKQAARMVRKAWHMDGPATTSMIANIFAIRESDLSDCLAGPTRPVSAGFRIGEEPDRMRIAWHIRSPAGRRFSLARMVADHLVSPLEERLLPVTRTVTGRQQFQRAFAQEFLCPYDALREVVGGSPSVDDIQYAADYFAVSTWVVVCSFVNNGALPQETLADWGVSLATQNW